MLLHHPGTRLPPIHPCDTPNASKNKTTYTPEELHCLTGCHHFRNYQHIILTFIDGTLLNSGKFPLSLGSYATILKAPRGKPIDCLLSKYLDIVHVGIAFDNCVSIGRFKYTLIFVDRATCYSFYNTVTFYQYSSCFGTKRDPSHDNFDVTVMRSCLVAPYVSFFMSMSHPLPPVPQDANLPMDLWNCIG
jgi:hypothetical protein